MSNTNGNISDKLCLALDMDDLVVALRLAKELKPHFGVAKVGLELFSASGPDAVIAMQDLGYDVFLDLKLHDIPTTVEKAARVIGALGVKYLTIHAMGGPVMLRAGVDGFLTGAAAAGSEEPIALAVTVLTSDNDAPEHILPKRIAHAVEAGTGGVICAGTDVTLVKQLAPRMKTVVPGTRPAGAPTHDQARVTTPAEAIAAGADVLVIGRVVTAAAQPLKAAEELAASIG
ncbi:MAG: putative orotidine 5-phosphate decarboxylase [Actinomycetia bacterium]|nr:putative orotidine 5-phosphate decarboxylase [Actinomycetes bacterium]